MAAVKVKGSRQSWEHPHAYWLIPACMALVLCLVHWRLQHRPAPLPATSAPTVFSEARARQHLDVFANVLVDRQVSMPGLQAATNYLTEQLYGLQQMAAGRADVDVQVVKHMVTGAAGMTFTRVPFTNAYRALDTLVLVITPHGTDHLKGLLIASHHDSAVCSQGASDDASQASVMLEAARVLLSRPQLPSTPIIFLWTGGEEPISPAAHGWMSQSPWYARAGAFINLEAMGGGGMPIVFQHAGSWVLEAYARGCPMPRGSRVAQDIFDLHIIPADSDFRMFSATHYGSLPGIDIAFVLDSTAYHSYLDAPARVKSGVLQEMGDGLLGGLVSVTQELARRQQSSEGKEKEPAGDAAHEQNKAALDTEDAKRLSVYWDFLGYSMVTYPDDVARRIHHLPALLLATAPLFWHPPYSARGKVLTWHAYCVMMLGAAYAFASILLSVGLPIALGCARTLLSDKPMVWFANHWLGHLQFLPLAVVGALLPWSTIWQRASASPLFSEREYMALLLQGCGFTTSMVAVLLTVLGMTGNASLFMMNGTATLLVSWLIATPRLSSWRLAALLLVCIVPMTVGSSVVALFLEVMMERMALAGFVHAVVADAIVGALSGLGVLAATCGVFLPLLGYLLRPGSRRWILGGLAALSLSTAIISSMYYPAYLPTAPKRVIISHLIQTRAVGGGRSGVGGKAGGGVAMEVVRQAVSIAGADSTMLSKAINLSVFTLVDAQEYPRRYMPLYPLDVMLHGVVVAVPDAMSVLPIDRQRRYSSVLPPDMHNPPCTHSNSEGSDNNRRIGVDAGNTNGSSDSDDNHDSGRNVGSSSDLRGSSRSGMRQALHNVSQSCVFGAFLQEVAHPEVLITQLPFIQLTSMEVKHEQQRVRLHLRMYSELPCWGVLNITAPGLVAWSFTSTLSPGPICETCHNSNSSNNQQHMVRFTTQDADPYWPFWLDLKLPDSSQQQQEDASQHALARSAAKAMHTREPQLPVSRLVLAKTTPEEDVWGDGDRTTDPGSSSSGHVSGEDVLVTEAFRGLQLRVEQSTQYLQRTPALRRVLALLPEHTAETWLATAYQSFWEL